MLESLFESVKLEKSPPKMDEHVKNVICSRTILIPQRLEGARNAQKVEIAQGNSLSQRKGSGTIARAMIK